jgi:hypothetical protein
MTARTIPDIKSFITNVDYPSISRRLDVWWFRSNGLLIAIVLASLVDVLVIVYG